MSNPIREALVVAENALEQNVIMCDRAQKHGIDHAGPLRVVTEHALAEARAALSDVPAHPGIGEGT